MVFSPASNKSKHNKRRLLQPKCNGKMAGGMSGPGSQRREPQGTMSFGVMPRAQAPSSIQLIRCSSSIPALSPQAPSPASAGVASEPARPTSVSENSRPLPNPCPSA